MNKGLSSVLPIFRSAQQMKVLGHLLINSGRTFTVPEIVRQTGVSQPTVSREVDRLRQARLVGVRRVGRSMLVSADDSSPFFPELRSLAVKLFGPAVLLGDRLGAVEGVEEAFVFGSWARRYRGEEGAPPEDVDVLIVGTADVDDVEEACEPLRDVLGLPINAVVVSRSEWDRARSGFLRRVKSQPLVRVLGDAA